MELGVTQRHVKERLCSMFLTSLCNGVAETLITKRQTKHEWFELIMITLSTKR